MVLPPVLVLLVVLGVVISSTLKARRRKREEEALQVKHTVHDDAHSAAFHLEDEMATNVQSEPTLFEKVLPPVLSLLFILYPVVTKNAFDGFPCYTFENGRGWLIADVSIVSTQWLEPGLSGVMLN